MSESAGDATHSPANGFTPVRWSTGGVTVPGNAAERQQRRERRDDCKMVNMEGNNAKNTKK